MQLDKIREIQAKGLKFGNYADDKELFERMLENSGFSQNWAQELLACSKMKGNVARRFVYDPKTEEILAFESEAPGVGAAYFLAQTFGGSGPDEKPMVFTGDESLNFITNNKPNLGDDENENPRSIHASRGIF